MASNVASMAEPPKARAFLAWLAGHSRRRAQLGWSEAQLVEAAGQYARAIGCHIVPSVPWSLAVRLGLQHMPGLRVVREVSEGDD